MQNKTLGCGAYSKDSSLGYQYEVDFDGLSNLGIRCDKIDCPPLSPQEERAKFAYYEEEFANDVEELKKFRGCPEWYINNKSYDLVWLGSNTSCNICGCNWADHRSPYGIDLYRVKNLL